jgi:hypothetical protein
VSIDGGPLPPEVAAALHRLDELVCFFEEHRDATVQDAAIEMLRAVDVLHRGALQHLGALLAARGLLDDALAEPVVALLFALYGDEEEEPEVVPIADASAPTFIPVSAVTRRR